MKQDETFVRGGNNPYARSNGVQAVRLIFQV